MSLSKEIRHFFSASRNSLRGIRMIARETAFRQELIFGVLHYALIVFLDIPFAEKLVLAAVWPPVLAAELLNSAIEAVVDRVSPEWSEFAMKAKDFASAAVGLLIASTVLLWAAVLVKRFVLN